MPAPTDPPPEDERPPDHAALDGQAWAELKRFVEFDEADVERLRQLGVPLEAALDEVVERFHAHLLGFDETRRVFDDEDATRRLRASMRQYLRSLLAGEYGEPYLRARQRTGSTHERVGLALRWYHGAHWLLLRDLVPAILPAIDAGARAQLLSLLKVMTLDMQVITESYLDRIMALVREQNERLDEIVHQRTRQLTKWERLAAVGSMSAKVAHEIRNPLSSISLNTELLSDELASYRDVDTGESRELLQSISGELERLSRIVDEYLQFARMPRLELEPVDLHELVTDVVKFLHGEFKRLGIAIAVSIDDGLSHLALDRSQFRQVLLNLLRNAQEAMPAGGTIRVGVRALEDTRLALSVSDTGVGIDPAAADRLFDPFYTTKDTGTGLGLAYVQQVVQEHHGEVRAAGVDGDGACFEILLPAKLLMRGWDEVEAGLE